MRFERSTWDEIREYVKSYYEKKDVLVDSFLETHIIDSNHYIVVESTDTIGYCSIHKENTMTLFNVFDSYAQNIQEIFSQAKKLEQVTNAMVPTGDEHFLSLCIDNFTRIEKQAYFTRYTDKFVKADFKKIDLEKMDVFDEEHIDRTKTCEGFLNEEIEQIQNGKKNLELYFAYDESKIIGFGVIEYSSFLNFASVGMYVIEKYRQNGYARSILFHLKEHAEALKFKTGSGCWYYNHNSKKSMESAGAVGFTRLLRFYF